MENFEDIKNKAIELLKACRISEKKKEDALLMMEEFYIHLNDFNMTKDLALELSKGLFGKSLVLVYGSEETGKYNPLKESQLWEKETDSIGRCLILSHRRRLNWKFSKGRNRISIRL